MVEISHRLCGSFFDESEGGGERFDMCSYQCNSRHSEQWQHRKPAFPAERRLLTAFVGRNVAGKRMIRSFAKWLNSTIRRMPDMGDFTPANEKFDFGGDPHTPIDDPAAKHGDEQIEAADASSAGSGDEIEDMADAALRPIEAAGARWAGWSAREYVDRIYDIDAADYSDDTALIDAMNAADADDDARPEHEPTFSFEASSAALDSSGEDTIEAGSADQFADQVLEVADSCLTPQEAADVQDMNVNAAQYIDEKYDVNPARINDETRLMEAISETRREQ